LEASQSTMCKHRYLTYLLSLKEILATAHTFQRVSLRRYIYCMQSAEEIT
jgi:hypothetical protein